uniref:Troponin I n=1 Tax=Arion vulgaris TaxID=1028688 RepID=A0A0B6ZPT3_9EUPU
MSSLEERREARRRRRGADDEDAPAEEDTSSRRGRRRGTEDETPAETPAAAVEDDSGAREEEERRRREEEEAAAAERQRQEAERKRRQEEERRQQEEKRRKEEEEERRKAQERAERDRMEAEEEAREKAEEEERKKKKGKRKGLGGLSAEKKKLLKKLIMQKAAEDLRNEAKQKAAEKEKYINDRVLHIKTDGKTQAELVQLVQDLHQRVSVLEEDVYDWEIKIRKQDFEINELTLKVNDTKGKFIKPVLRKVNKTESKLKKIQQIKESTDFRGNLKSTGQNKYALDEEEPEKNPHWRDELKPKDRADEEAGAGEGETVEAES